MISCGALGSAFPSRWIEQDVSYRLVSIVCHLGDGKTLYRWNSHSFPSSLRPNGSLYKIPGILRVGIPRLEPILFWLGWNRERGLGPKYLTQDSADLCLQAIISQWAQCHWDNFRLCIPIVQSRPRAGSKSDSLLRSCTDDTRVEKE